MNILFEDFFRQPIGHGFLSNKFLDIVLQKS